MTREAFDAILIEEGIDSQEERDKIWDTRPDDAITEEQLRAGSKAYIRARALKRALQQTREDFGAW